MEDKKVPDGFVLSQEDLEENGITQEELDELEETVEEYTETVREFESDIDRLLTEINTSPVYEKLGVELVLDIEYLFAIDDGED